MIVGSTENKKLTHNLGTWPQGEKRAFKFDNPGVVTLLCNVHPEMEAFVVVLGNPFWALSDKDGNFKIEHVPAGKFTLMTFAGADPKADPVPVVVTPGSSTGVTVTLKH